MIFGRAPEKISFKNAKPPKILSTATLRITRSGPKETNFAIVDIPVLLEVMMEAPASTKVVAVDWLVVGDDKDPNKRKALELVMKYLKNPSSIVCKLNVPEREKPLTMYLQCCDWHYWLQPTRHFTYTQ